MFTKFKIQMRLLSGDATYKLDGSLFFEDLVTECQCDMERPSLESFVDKTRQSELLRGFNKDGVQVPIHSSRINFLYSGLFDEKHKIGVGGEVRKQLLDEKSMDRLLLHFAPPGSGKTFGNIKYACKFPSIYVMCNAGLATGSIWKDASFSIFQQKMGILLAKNEHIIEGDSCILIFLIARIFYYRFLLQKFKDLTPTEFLIAQMNGYQPFLVDICKRTYAKLNRLSYEEILKVLDNLMRPLINVGLRLIIDEANVISDVSKTGERFLTPGCTLRGLLPSWISLVLENFIFRQIVVSGTNFSIDLGDELMSTVGKYDLSSPFLCNYDYLNSTSAIVAALKQFLYVEDCEAVLQDEDCMIRLIGRVRLLTNVIEDIPGMIGERQVDLSIDIKPTSLRAAIDKSYKTILGNLYDLMKSKYNCLNEKEKSEFLETIRALTLSQSFAKPFVIRTIQASQHILDVGLLLLKEITSEYSSQNLERNVRCSYWSLFEPVAFECCTKFIADHGNTSPLLHKEGRKLSKHLETHQFHDASHGKLFERCCLEAACEFSLQNSNAKFCDWPIVKHFLVKYKDSVKFPEWITKVPISFKRFGTAKDLGYSDDADAIQKMFSGNTSNILMPENQFGADGLANSVFGGYNYVTEWSFKLFHNGVPWGEHVKSYKTTDPNWIYSTQRGEVDFERAKVENLEREMQIQGQSWNGSILNKIITKYFQPSKKQIHTDVKKLLTGNIGGVLRIHVEIPYAKGCRERPMPKVEVNGTDVAIWVSLDELDALFPSDKTIVKDMRTLLAMEGGMSEEKKTEKNKNQLTSE